MQRFTMRAESRGIQHKCSTSLQFEHLEDRQLLATYFVDDLGSDSLGDGSIGNPFGTINHAQTLAVAGDTVSIREGVYREQVTVQNSGTSLAPIRFEAYQGEDVVISGGDLIGGWVLAPEVGPDVWKTTAPSDAGGNRNANTLFVNGDMKLEAGKFADVDRLDITSWGRVGQLSDYSTTMNSVDLVGYGDDYWNGARIVIQVIDGGYVTRTITDYDSATGTVTLHTDVGPVNRRAPRFFRIYDTIKALDKPGEWYKDGNTLYFKAETGQDPNSLEIEWKSRAFAFDVAGRQYIEIDGFQFRGASINTLNSDHSLISNNVFYAWDRGGFGDFKLNGDHFEIRDNEFSLSWRSAVDFAETNRTDFVNNYLHDIGLSPRAAVFEAFYASELLISHNTIRKIGRGVFDGYPVRSEIAYNLFEDAGRTAWDTGIFDADGGNGNNSFTIVHHNLFRDSAPVSIIMPFYGGNGNLIIHHNIIYDWELQLQGTPRETFSATFPNFRYAYHNTIIGTPPVGSARDGYKPPESLIEYNWNNNLQLSMDRVDVLGADTRGSYNYSPSDFVNFNARDLRLAAGSGAIDTGVVLPGINDGYLGASPDAGAIEFGENMWQVGHDFSNKPNPTYDWELPPGTNLYANGLFSQGMDDWQIVSGTPDAEDRNSWNLGPASFTGSTRTQSIELQPGAAIRRDFTDLKPNTLYTLGAAGRIGRIATEGGNYDSASGTVSTGTYRDTFYVAGLTDDPNSWVEYQVDFGALGQFDTLEVIAGRADRDLPAEDAVVEVWLDGPAGQLLGTMEYRDLYGGYVLNQPLTRLELPLIQGVHSLVLRVKGPDATNVSIGEIQLLQSHLLERDKLTASVLPFGEASVNRQFGWTDWQFGYEILEFTTGSNGSASITFNNAGRTAGYLDRMFLLEGVVRQGSNIAYLVADGTQSSTVGQHAAAAAVDGDVSTYSETLDESNSWWQTDLGGTLSVGEIVLTNRNDARFDELSNFTVSVWDTEPESGGTKLWEQSYFSTGSVSQGESFRISGNTLGTDGVTRLASAFGRVIRVQLDGLNNAGNGHLSLAEVAIRSSADAAPTGNVAFNRPTQQTEQYYGRAGKSEHAVNGVVDTFAEYSAATSPIVNAGEVWWQVDLERSTEIDQIVVVNNDNDRIGNFRVSVWDADPRAGGQEVWGKNYSYSSSAPYVSTNSIGYGTSLRIDGNTVGSNGSSLSSIDDGRFVRVELIGNLAGPHNLLVLSEVQVWAQNPEPSLTLSVDRVTGQAVLSNLTTEVISLNGYAINDSSGSLSPSGWFSLSDQQYDQSQWVESSTSTVQVTEQTDGAQISMMSPGESLSLGKLFNPFLIGEIDFHHFLSSGTEVTTGQIVMTNLNTRELVADYNADLVVDGADFLSWQVQKGQEVQAFDKADGNGSQVVERADQLLWARQYGAKVTEQTLIDPMTANGSFENFTGGQGAPEQTNSNRVAASFNSTNVTDTAVATIPGWTLVLERYLDGNSGNTFAGFDSAANRASDGQRYAFANKRSRATLTSDPITNLITTEGDHYTLVFDTGSVESSNADYLVRLVFGTEVRELGNFTETADGGGGVAAYTQDRTFSYTAIASDSGAQPRVEFVINAGASTSNGQWYIDNVRFDVRRSTAPNTNLVAAASAPISTIEGETQIEDTRRNFSPELIDAAIALANVTSEEVEPLIEAWRPDSIETAFAAFGEDLPIRVEPSQEDLADKSTEETEQSGEQDSIELTLETAFR